MATALEEVLGKLLLADNAAIQEVIINYIKNKV